MLDEKNEKNSNNNNNNNTPCLSAILWVNSGIFQAGSEVPSFKKTKNKSEMNTKICEELEYEPK